MNFEYLRKFFIHLRFICEKELLATFKDKTARQLLLAPVLIQGLLFGYGATYNLDQVPFAVLDMSHTKESTSLIAHIDGTTAFSRVKTLYSTNEIARAMDSGNVMAVIVIPSDFESKLAHNEQAPIQLITDGSNTMTAGLIASYIGRITAAWNAANVETPPIELITRTWFNPNQTTRWAFLPGLIALISFTQVIMLAGLSIAKEKEQGTFDQLLVAPFSQLEILVGKALPPMLIGMFQSTVLFLLALFWFEIPFSGSIFLLYVTLFIFVLSSTGIGLTISAISNSMQQVLVYVFVLLLPLSLLSGIATPIHNMPEALQIFTYADPLRFAIDALRRIYLEGAGLKHIYHDFIPMLCVAAITLPFAGWLFRNKTT